MHYLGIDAGASATKWALINDLGVVKSGIDASMDGHIYRTSSRERMQEVSRSIAKQIQDFKLSKAFIGITGVLQDGSIEELLTSTFKAPVTVVSDIELAYRANFSPGEGILLYAGTGSVAYAIDEKVQVHKIGGWGYLLGDEGGGYWIGREAIRNTLLSLESGKSMTPNSLTELISHEIKGHNWEAIKEFVYSNERSAIAALSQIVDAAARNGSPDAISILNKAAGLLVELVHRIDHNLVRKSLPIKFTGGISTSDILYTELEKFLRGRVSRSTIDIAVRAAELAR